MYFYVYFRGTRNGEWIEAASLHSAKWIFAERNGLNSLAYITGKNKPVARPPY